MIISFRFVSTGIRQELLVWDLETGGPREEDDRSLPYVEVCQLSIGTNVPKDPDQMSAHAQSNERTKNLELYSSAHFRLSMTEVIDW